MVDHIAPEGQHGRIFDLDGDDVNNEGWSRGRVDVSCRRSADHLVRLEEDGRGDGKAQSLGGHPPGAEKKSVVSHDYHV